MSDAAFTDRDNLFGDDEDLTMVRNAQPTGFANAGQSDTFTYTHNGINPLVQEASELLHFLAFARNIPHHADPAGLRAEMVERVKSFTTRISRMQYEHGIVMAARYCICSAIDEIVLLTQWGNNSEWSTNSLLMTFHQERHGGKKFFEILKRLMAKPATSIDLLELLYICLRLGFEGEYRVATGGQTKLASLISDLSKTIAVERGIYETALTKHWQGATQPYKRPSREIPRWLLAVSCVAMLLIIYLFFAASLQDKTQPLERDLEKVAQVAPVTPRLTSPQISADAAPAQE